MAVKFQLPNDPHAIDVSVDESGNPTGQTPQYGGVEFRSNLGGLVQESYSDQLVAESGVFGDRHFKITIDGRNIVAAGGQAALGTGKGVYLCSMNGANTLGEYTVADTNYSRIDRVVLRVDDPSNGGGQDRAGYIQVIDGTPASTPAIPSVTGATQYLDLGYITVPKNGSGAPSIADPRKFTVATGGVRRVMKTSEVSTAIPIGSIVYDQEANLYKVRKASGFAVLQEVLDTGWVALTDPSSGWDVRDALRIRRRNGVVYLRGAISNSTFEGGFTRILTIPTGYRPATTVQGAANGNSVTNRTMELRSDGGLYVWHSAKSAAWDTLTVIPPYLVD